MTDQELLYKILDKVDYINHKTTQLETDMVWVKWFMLLIAAIIIGQTLKGLLAKKKNNK